jgi:hypothetical protein
MVCRGSLFRSFAAAAAGPNRLRPFLRASHNKACCFRRDQTPCFSLSLSAPPYRLRFGLFIPLLSQIPSPASFLFSPRTERDTPLPWVRVPHFFGLWRSFFPGLTALAPLASQQCLASSRGRAPWTGSLATATYISLSLIWIRGASLFLSPPCGRSAGDAALERRAAPPPASGLRPRATRERPARTAQAPSAAVG